MEAPNSMLYGYNTQEMVHPATRRGPIPQFDMSMPIYPSGGVSYGTCFPPMTAHYNHSFGSHYNLYENTMHNQVTPLHPPRVLPPSMPSLLNVPPARNAVVQTESNPFSRVDDISISQYQSFDSSTDTTSTSSASESHGPRFGVDFATEVDTLMKAIQSKASPPSPSHPLPFQFPSTQQPPPQQQQRYDAYYSTTPTPSTTTSSNDGTNDQPPKKRYPCTHPHCTKTFLQKTHLEIHLRAHTGHKPFPCTFVGCNARFSQLGNLRTHERRHSGERPFTCPVCAKPFAQRGNVRAHAVVHSPSPKPFSCLLDSCGKTFTQLGNLKSHQNKFHAETIRELTRRFSRIRSEVEMGEMGRAEVELWRYFSGLYRNANKGIKGRGKDRKIAAGPGGGGVMGGSEGSQSGESLVGGGRGRSVESEY